MKISNIHPTENLQNRIFRLYICALKPINPNNYERIYLSPLEDIFHACYRRPKANEEGKWFTAAEMFRTMNKRNASALRGISAKQLSYRLTAMGFKPRHTDHGNYYHVVQTGTAA